MCTDQQILQSIKYMPAYRAVNILEELKASGYRQTEIKGIMQTLDRLQADKIDLDFAETICAAMIDSEEGAKRIFAKYHQLEEAA